MENAKKQLYIILAGIGAVLAVFVAVFIFPYLNEIKKNSEDFISGKNKLDFFEKQVESVEEFKKNYKALNLNLEKIARLYVDSKNPASFFEFLENLAGKNNINAEISILPQKNKKQADFMEFQVFCRGSFSDTLTFLEKLETGPFLLEVKKMSARSAGGSLETSFLIKAYTK